MPGQLRVDGAKLAVLRAALGWSKKKLAKEAGVDYSTYWRIEKGQAQNPRVETVQKLARALDTAVEGLTMLVGEGAVTVSSSVSGAGSVTESRASSEARDSRQDRSASDMLSPDPERKQLIGEVALRLARGDSTRSVAEYLHRFEGEVDADLAGLGGRDAASGGGSPGGGDPP